MTVENLNQSNYAERSQREQREFLAITGHWLKAREISCVQSAIGLGFASRWLKNWRESF